MSFARELLENVFAKAGEGLEDAAHRAMADRVPDLRGEVLARALSMADGTTALAGRLARAIDEVPAAYRHDLALAEGAREDRRGDR